ncbi:MAG: thioredoxin domain-containing protein [Deltaproteobacteria bacterium]|nr:thioredoxin domain-containing protein [Deltaproteobacteria bacterium]
MSESRPNHLLNAASPYLQQHAYNPVDWYPWGPEALEKARREDKPIFLSIGYSTCHWCHVMAHECFEDQAIAAVLNEHFVSIKVDREERPDLDETYMSVVTALTGRGGWPMSVFLTPDLKPFYGGPYFPPEDRGGLPGFPRLLLALDQAYRKNQEQIEELSRRVIGHLQTLGEIPGERGEPSRETLDQAIQQVLQGHDPVHGGLGGAPKFPRSLEFGLMLHYYHLTRDPEVLDKLGFTLEKMARGGIYDQLGGGFHRYTVDGAWVVPHFEKMLYDNALLPPLYLAHYQLTGSLLSRRIAAETLDFVLRDLQAPDGGFYAAWDADSEGVEGKYYVWSFMEVEEVLGHDKAALVARALGVSLGGNFEGTNVLTRPHSREELAAHFGITRLEVDQALEIGMEALRRVRATRVLPHRDDKIVVSWNGLMVAALAQGFQVLGDRRYYEAAARAARFILADLFREDHLYRSWHEGRLSVPGFCDDYAHLAYGLLELYETDFDPAWLEAARRLVERLDDLFLDPESGVYFYVARDQEAPLVRARSVFDQVLPSGNSMAARVCLKLHRITEEERYRDRALGILGALQTQARENPWSFAHLLTVQALYLIPPVDLTLVGDPGDTRTQALLQTVYRYFLPERRLLLKNPAAPAALEALAPAARAYSSSDGVPVAYLCHHFTCLPGLSDSKELAAELEKVGGRAGEAVIL